MVFNYHQLLYAACYPNSIIIMLAIIKHFIAINAHQITTAFDAADFAFAYPLNW